jgi:hypothetical protein
MALPPAAAGRTPGGSRNAAARWRAIAPNPDRLWPLPPSKVRSDRLPNGPLTGVRRKRNAFVFSTNRPAGRMPLVGEDVTLHPEPLRRTGVAFADASD